MPHIFVRGGGKRYPPAGMIKSGSSTTAASGSLKQVSGMIADPAFPGSSVISNALRPLVAGTDVTFTFSVNCTNNFTTTTTAAVYKNGALVGTTFTRTGGSATFIITGSVTGSVAANDLITLMVSAANGTTTILTANTWLNVT